VTITRNSLGFRGEEPPPDFARRLTLLTIGGSTTECLDLDDARTWPHLLGVKLQEDFPRLWLNNAGLSGHSSFGHLVLLEDYVARLRPKVALFLVGINDLGLKEGGDFDRRTERRLSFRSLDGFLVYLAGKSEVASALLNLHRYYFPKNTLVLRNQEADVRSFPALEVSPAQRKARLVEHAANYLPAYRRRLELLVAACRRLDILPVFLTQPALYGPVIDPDTGVDLGKIRIDPHMDGALAWELLELYNDVLRQVGREKGLLVIDLAREMPKRSRFYYDLIHHTNAGAQELASLCHRRLAPYLIREASRRGW